MGEPNVIKVIFHTLRKRFWIILAVTALAVGISAIWTHFFVTPSYEASAQILVNKSTSKQSVYDSGDIQTSMQLINTYGVIVTSPPVLEQAIRDAHLGMTESDLRGLISIDSVKDSQVFTVTAETNDPSLSVKIANGVAAAFKKQITKVMNIDNVSVLAKANLSDSDDPVSPDLKMNMALAILIGLVISVALAFLLEYLDGTIKTAREAEIAFQLPVIGSVGEIPASNRRRKRSQREQLKALRRDHIEA